MKKICVIGSFNMDLVVTVERFSKPGETITGREFGAFPGGKGANQAVAVGRLGADVKMVGKLGNDLYGKEFFQVLHKNNVNAENVEVEKNFISGIAVIEVDGFGENHIVIIPGANYTVDCSFIDRHLDQILENDIFLFQLEIPLETVTYAICKLKEYGKTIILDPAPVRPIPDKAFESIDFLTPNEAEMEALTGTKITTETDLKRAIAVLLEKGPRNIIAKVGKKGAYIGSRTQFSHVPGFDVNSIDTTAAGDSFNAGFAYALADGKELRECVRFANAVGALATTGKGAQGAMPTLHQVCLLMMEKL
jgi:ribokinase